jgi:large subunit ribosomal protein L21
MFAVFESGGKQHRVSEGELVKLEKLEGDLGDSVVFEKVMVIANGDDVSVGTPYVEGGRVEAEVVDQSRNKKISVVKFKRRKNYLRRGGHKQLVTWVRITGISN